MYNATNNEQQLLKELANGGRAATELIYKQQFQIINGWLIKNNCDSDDAADIFQEAMVVLFEKAQSPDFRLTCNVGTYLFAISKHLWYKRLQKQQKNPIRLFDATEDENEDNAPSYFDDIKVHEERETHIDQLNNALDQLGEPCRSLLHAYYHKDNSMAQIAADFGYTNPENAKTQKYKCLTRLRKLFYGMQAK